MRNLLILSPLLLIIVFCILIASVVCCNCSRVPDRNGWGYREPSDASVSTDTIANKTKKDVDTTKTSADADSDSDSDADTPTEEDTVGTDTYTGIWQCLICGQRETLQNN